jgi:Nif-specific regulatory protein
LLADNDRLRQQLRDIHRLSDLAGSSRAIRQIVEVITQVAPSVHTVWLRGEAGVGKARAARAIHRGSLRSSGPFVTVNCAAMPDAAVDAQLFGADAGSPAEVSAVGGCVGRAVGGTLFLDEVTALGSLAQSRLVVLARERVWVRADGTRVHVDVRLIGATTRNTDELVAAGRFRRDLWDANGALMIAVPPLRDRKGDLPVLTDLFVEQFAREHVRLVSRVSGRAMDMLMNYDWPGNVSELCRTIERAVVLTTGPVIYHHHLPPGIQEAGGLPAPALGLSEALDAYEKELLEDALRQARGVRSQAARLLMTSERMLGYRLRKHGINSRRFKT